VILIKNIYTLWGRKQRTDRRTDGQTDMARSTPLLIPDQEYIYFMGSETLPSAEEYIYFMGSETLPSACYNIYTLWGRKRFLRPVTYFSTNLVYPFTLRVTRITVIQKITLWQYKHVCVNALYRSSRAANVGSNSSWGPLAR